MKMLFQSLALLPLSLALPALNNPRADSSCDYATYRPTFHLLSAQYSSEISYTTPAHLAVSYATIEFNLTNTVDDTIQVNCKGASSSQQYDAGFFAYPKNVQCTGTGGIIGSASFSYTRADNKVAVNETWSCGG